MMTCAAATGARPRTPATIAAARTNIVSREMSGFMTLSDVVGWPTFLQSDDFGQRAGPRARHWPCTPARRTISV